MTEHLHSFNFFSSNNFVLANRAYAIHSLISRLILYLFCLISVFSLSAQEVDNWYSADRAINAPSPVGDLFLFTPYAPADGTPVNVWYELVDYNFNFTQNAMEHPPGPYPGNYNRPWENYPNHGFQHPGGPGFLTPTGAIPGVPTLRRDVMNFNPAVQFDGTSGGGAGEALYFRSHARDESMVIVVFSAPGAGTTAETQSLLFGGDITNHLNTITNLSLGVSSGNRFSVGRTWDSGTFFQTGGIDLLERPTIGVLSRSFPAVQQETLTTRVNGLNDVNITRLDPTAQESLFYYNRMGKHFNDADPGGISDPSNLSGYIAEVMLVEGISDANHIQRLESYLAIKYGITLNAIGGLGSINGNDSYNYLAADGTIIWPFDATYRYDIAGIGKDRFNDSGVNRLRYNLHQRISKSVNAEARVTISTNSDFSADNLDDTRTAIDASHFSLPRELNYLVWGNDHGDIIFPTNVNTPVGFDGRIPRQWRIIETRSGGTNPIINVSVRIDLTGSDLLNYEACEIFLIIDEDGNGNFGDGVITSIEASSIIGSDVFFYNVNFVGTDVFTVAYLEDVQPPTASNPAPLTVCEVIPLPDTSVVTDEADNCAVDTVVHISDVSNLMSNPETITRTYRVTDTSGNFMDVFQTITIYTTPDAGNDNTVQICEGDATPLSLPASLGGVPELGGTWTDVNNVLGNGLNSPITDATAAAMNFSTVASGSYDFVYTITATAPCNETFATITVTVNSTPTVDVLADVTVCDSFELPALTTGDYFTGTGGTGTPLSAGDDILTTQTVFIYAETGTTPNCSDESSFTVTVNRISALVSMDNELCLDSGTGSINVLMETGVTPYTVQLNAMQAIIFNTNSFTINDLVSGTYTLNIADAQGCETSEIFDIEAEGIDLSAEITPVYGCDLGEFSNYIDVELNNSIVSSDVLYALDSTDPNDFIINLDFINISEGEHFLSILYVNGCMETIPFEIEEREPLRLSLNSSNINQITATVTGGTAPYTYFFDDHSGSGDNTYSITYSGIHSVRVLDGNGCEVIQTISLEFLDIEIPNFFTPNNDGIRDVWKPENIEGFPNIETVIFDRYGREIRLLGALGNGWDGFYEGKPLPSGDYWYIVKLNDGSKREFVGNFTLYR